MPEPRNGFTRLCLCSEKSGLMVWSQQTFKIWTGNILGFAGHGSATQHAVVAPKSPQTLGQ